MPLGKIVIPPKYSEKNTIPVLRGLKFYGFFTIISIMPKNACGLACTEEKTGGNVFEKRNGYRT